MGAATTHHTATKHHGHDDHAHGSHELPPAVQLKANRLGLWMFCFSEIFLFGALLAARFYLWQDPVTGVGTRPELSQPIGLVATIVLLVSSFYINRAETAIAHGDRDKFLSGLMTTAVLGILFFISVVVLEWNVFGLEGEIAGIELFGHLKPTDGVHGAMFFAMTGMHTLHVVSGVLLILFVWGIGKRGGFSPESHWGVEACAIYWHFVDVVWVFFYPALYLIGTVLAHG